MRVMRARFAGLGLGLALIAAACAPAGGATAGPGSSPSATSPASVAPPSPAPTPAPSKGPAGAQFSVDGTNGLTGPVTTTSIMCDNPTLSGLEIEALGHIGTNGPDFVLFVTAGHIEARVATGSAQTLKLRSFIGSGVTSFDPATGVQLDSSLTESTAPGSAIGTLGALSRISGSLDCGNEGPGTSTIALTGTSALGSMSGVLSPSRVLCTVTPSATYVGLQALGMAGSAPVLVFVSSSPGMVSAVVETATAANQYLAKGDEIVTISSTGAQIKADLTENVKAGVPPHMLHVEGSETCGITINQ